jgi:RNA polymerase sigma factor (sigma-70 family)
MEDERTPQPDICVAYTQLRQRVVASLADLPEREAQLLRLRFGLDTDHPHSLQEIGTLFGLSRERVRQLEKLALEKLRLSASAAVLADFAEVIE